MMQSVRDYDDVNENLRFWLDRVFRTLSLPVFYDLGANDGVFSRSYADRALQVYAFEPSSEACRRLRRLIAEEDIDNVTVFRLALSDAPAEVTLHRFSNDTFNSLFPRTEFELGHYSLSESEPERVSTVRLDDLVEELQLSPPSVVKIDIEGAELFALRGAEATLRSSMPVLLVEYSVDNTANAGYRREEILELISSWGYVVRGLYRNIERTLRAPGDLDDRGVWNLLCASPAVAEGLFRD